MRSFMPPYRRNVDKKQLDSLMTILINNKTGDGAIRECKSQIKSLKLSSYTLENFTNYVLASLQIDQWTFNDRGQLEAPSTQLKTQADAIRKAILKKTDARRLELGKKCLAATYELKKNEKTDSDYRKFLLAYVSFRVDDNTRKGDSYYKTDATLNGVPIITLYDNNNSTLQNMKEIQLEHAYRTMGFPSDYTEWVDKLGNEYANDIFSFASACLENYLKPLGGYVPKINFMVEQDVANRPFPGVAEMIYVYAYAYGLNSDLSKGKLYDKAATAQSTAWKNVTVSGGMGSIDTMFNDIVNVQSVEAFINPIPKTYQTSGTLNSILQKGLSGGSSSGPVKPPKKPGAEPMATPKDIRQELESELNILVGTLKDNPKPGIKNFLCHHIVMLQKLYNWNETEEAALKKVYNYCVDYTAPNWELLQDEGNPFS